MSTATLEGVTSTRGRVQIPAWGAWWADVDLVDAESLSGSVTLTVLDQTLIGTAVSGGPANGRASYRIVGGAGGWGQMADAKSYANDAGVRASIVLGDLADAVGETMTDAPTTQLGPHYARQAGLASQTLNALCPQSWHIGLDGVTRGALRAAATYDGDAPRVRVDPGVVVVDLAVDDTLTALVPGVSVDGSAAATDVEWQWDAKRLTIRVYAASQPSRRLQAWRRIAEAVDPRRAYRAVYEYRVVSQTGDRLNLQAVRVASGMPDLLRVPYRSMGARMTWTAGATVVVGFVGGDAARPFVIAGDEVGGPGWSPTLLELGDTGGDKVALSTPTDAGLDAIFGWFDSWVPVATDGGAALKEKVTSWKGTHPTGFDDTAAAKVEAK